MFHDDSVNTHDRYVPGEALRQTSNWLRLFSRPRARGVSVAGQRTKLRLLATLGSGRRKDLP